MGHDGSVHVDDRVGALFDPRSGGDHHLGRPGDRVRIVPQSPDLGRDAVRVGRRRAEAAAVRNHLGEVEVAVQRAEPGRDSLARCLDDGRLSRGDTVLLCGTAAGLTANALALRL